jgi:hypothetical protein
VKHILALVFLVFALLGTALDAHFVLVYPAASLLQDRLGDPQKIAPCGGVSANPARGTGANPGIPSRAVTELTGGAPMPLLVQETIFHPGHYRVALSRTAAGLPRDPEVQTYQTDRGMRSQSAPIANPVEAPVLADGLFVHTERPTQNFTAEVMIPNIECRGCVLQVTEFMAEHPGIAVDGGFYYHHCAIVNITPDRSKPLDTRWR